MTVPTYQSIANAASNGGSTSLSLNVPSGTVNGDLLITCVTIWQDQTLTPPSGWTFIDEQSTGGAVFMKTALYYRIASSEPASYNWQQGNLKDIIASCVRISGHIPSFNNALAKTGDLTSDGQLVFTGVTTTRDDTLLIAFGVVNEGTANTFTTPGSMTERADHATSSSPDSAPMSMVVATEVRSTAGATGTRTFTTNTSNPWGNGILIAIAGPLTSSQSVSGGVAPVGVPILRAEINSLQGALNPAGNLNKFITKVPYSGSISPAGSLTAQLIGTYLQSVAGNITPSGTVLPVKIGSGAGVPGEIRRWGYWLRRRKR